MFPSSFAERMLVSDQQPVGQPPGEGEATLHEPSVRAAAVRLMLWAAGSPDEPDEGWAGWANVKGPDIAGPPSLGDVSDTVTEGANRLSVKQRWKSGFSSCAKLAHWTHMCLGLRGHFVNMQALAGTGTNRHPGYRGQSSVSMLLLHPDFERMKTFDDVELLPGDTVVIGEGSRSHVAMVLSHSPGEARLATVDYGQDLRKAGTTDVRVKRFKCQGRAIRGGRVAAGRLPLFTAIQRADQTGNLDLAHLPPVSA